MPRVELGIRTQCKVLFFFSPASDHLQAPSRCLLVAGIQPVAALREGTCNINTLHEIQIRQEMG